MEFSQPTTLLHTALFAVMGALSANAALVFTDHPQGPTATTFYDGLTDVVAGNPPPGNNRFSLDAGDIDGQSFTVASPFTLDSIYLGYNDQQSTGSFNLLIDEGNDGSIEHSYLVELTTIGDLQTGGGNGGPFHFVQFDVSSDNIALAAGVHSFSVEGVTDNGEGGFLFAPTFGGDDYDGGQMLSNSGRDLQFAVTGIPEPSAAILGSLGLLALLRRRR